MIPWQRRTLALLAAWPLLVAITLFVKHWTAAPWLALTRLLWGWP